MFTSGATGTNAAVIRGALRAEKPHLLTVVLPQSLRCQPSESQELLQEVCCAEGGCARLQCHSSRADALCVSARCRTSRRCRRTTTCLCSRPAGELMEAG